MKKQDMLSFLKERSLGLGVSTIATHVIDDPRFAIASGSGKPQQHHYGDGGLLLHTYEVVKLADSMSIELGGMKHKEGEISDTVLYLAALFHDYGKVWDYTRVGNGVWSKSEHARTIHHISRSAIEFNLAIMNAEGLCMSEADSVTHCILSHHGCREWGSPVAPKSIEAHILHHCDAISARSQDYLTLDRF